MTKQFSTLVFSAITLSILAGCGTDTDPSVPKSVINRITNNYTITRGAYLELDGLGSTDDVKIVNYTWKIDDQVVSNNVTDKLLVRVPVGEHKVCLTTEDADKKSNMVCKNIKVIEQKVKTPTAIMNNIPSSGWKTKCKITIDGKESTANFERTIKSYKWLKDGTVIGSDANQTFVFDNAGKHNISLEVTDNKGGKDKITKSVQIAKIGLPTAKLTLVNVFNDPIFSDQSNENNKVWGISNTDTHLPYKSNFVFISATGSFDDCNLTDDNLTYSWTASIYNGNTNMAPASNAFHGIPSCWHNKMEYREEPMKFNGTKYVVVPLSTVKKNDGVYKYPSVDITSGEYGGWSGFQGWKEEKWEHVYLAMCSAHIGYTSLRIKLTVKDNLHGLETTVTKIVRTPEPR